MYASKILLANVSIDDASYLIMSFSGCCFCLNLYPATICWTVSGTHSTSRILYCVGDSGFNGSGA